MVYLPTGKIGKSWLGSLHGIFLGNIYGAQRGLTVYPSRGEAEPYLTQVVEQGEAPARLGLAC